MYLNIKGYSKEAIKKFYQVVSSGSLKKPGQYVLDEVLFDDVHITFYKTGTILFKGDYESLSDKIDILIDKKLYVGVDEVGVGENIGPYATAAIKFYDFESKKRVIMHGIKDSKKMTAKEITAAAKIIRENAEVQIILLDPVNFNIKYKKFKNMKALNAVAQNSLLMRFDSEESFVTDEFVNEKKYYEYLKTFQQTETRKVKLLPKAEDRYMEVAAAAIVAKSEFNNWMINFSTKYNLPLEIKQRVNTNGLWAKLKSGEIPFDEPELIFKNWSKE